MRQYLLIFAAFCCHTLQAQTYITNVSLIDVVRGKVVEDQTVVFKGEKITGILRGSVNIPKNAVVIDGKGKFLIPGLVDAHVHFFQSGGVFTRPDVIDLRRYKAYSDELKSVHDNFEGLLRRYVKSGITTVIDPGSSIAFLQQRNALHSDSLPTVYMTGPLLTTYEPDVYRGLALDEPFYKINTPAESRLYVRKELPFKPDFIKIWYIIEGKNIDSSARASLPLVKAAIEEAHKSGLPVAVHATERITAQLAVEAGADYLVHSVDSEVIDAAFVQLLKNKGTILCPTLVVGKNYYRVFAQQYQTSAEDSTLADPVALTSLFKLSSIPDSFLINRYKMRGAVLLRQSLKEDSIMFTNLKKLEDAGVTIATGTDAGNIGTMHVSSYFDEIRAMKSAGLSIPQILKASTINGAKVLGKEKIFGTIEKGKLANMVLLSANPLQSLDNWEKVEVVINKGNVITR